VKELVPSPETRELAAEIFAGKPWRLARMLKSRMARIEEKKLGGESRSPTLYGEKGIRDEE
jgi:hypothetical protein